MDRRKLGLANGDVETALRRVATTALWAALSADRRARDERTARLRAMRLVAGEDGEGEAA